MTQEIRWQYRFRNFSRAYSLLREALERGGEGLNQLEREGVIQRFEYTFELAWNLLRDRLQYDGIILVGATPRDVIREAAATGLVSDGQTWIDMLTDRDKTAHQYDFAIFEDVIRNISSRYLPVLNELYQRLVTVPSPLGEKVRVRGKMSAASLPSPILEQLRQVFAAYPDLTEVKLYGSYATGRATPRSDIDLATCGISDRYRLGRLALDLADLPIPQKCDIQAYERIRYEPLKRHIDAWGITIYLRPAENTPSSPSFSLPLDGGGLGWG